MKYSIGDFAKLTGLSIHTLRYYEHEGLITPKRNSGNRRYYTDKDLAWITFIKRLKATGMPIKQIRRYAELRTEGDSTLSARLAMLASHRQALNEQINQLKNHLEKLDEKIDFYRQKIERAQNK